MNKKKIIFIISCLILCFLLIEPCYVKAADTQTESVPNKTQSMARSEETRWVYRELNGIKQKRLWSLTYGYWKTDWINC